MDQSELHRLRALDRPELLALLKPLHRAMNALRRDECGDWTIFGSCGHIGAGNGKFFIYIRTYSLKAWTYAKAALSDIDVTQDGDEAGILMLRRMSTENEATLIRRYVGLRQTRDVPTDRRAEPSGPRHNRGIGAPMRFQGDPLPLSPDK